MVLHRICKDSPYRSPLWRLAILGSALTPLTLPLTTVALATLPPPAAFAQTFQSNLFAWGLGTYGQLGNGGTASSSTPVDVALPTGVDALASATGQNHGVALGSDYNVYAWGLGTSGQLGNGTKTTSYVPIQAHMPVPVSNSANDPVAAGGAFSLAIGSDGHVYAWGANADGQLGDGSLTSVDTPTLVSTLPSGFSAIAVAAGNNFSLALGILNGQEVLYAWGLGTSGQLGNGLGVTSDSAVQVAMPTGVQPLLITAGATFAMAVGDDGHLYSWGNNASGQLGNGTKTNALTPTQVQIGVLTGAIAAGNNFSLAVGYGGLYSWGGATDGQLANGKTSGAVTVPTVVTSLPVAASYALGAGSHTGYVVGSNGTMYAWGLGTSGQLGDGSNTSSASPLPVTDPPGLTPSSLFGAVASGTASSKGLAIFDAPTTTTISASPSTVVDGEPLTLTATVTPTDGSGTVSFDNNGSPISSCSSVPLANVGGSFQATCHTSFAVPATESLTAAYSGYGANLPSDSSALPLVVDPLIVPVNTVGAYYADSFPCGTCQFTEMTYDTTVLGEPTASTDAYFYANQFSFAQTAGYIGIYPGGGAHFSYFNSDYLSFDTSACTNSADQGPGVTCAANASAVPFALGDTYQTWVTGTAASCSGPCTTWTGYVQDVTAGTPAVEIGWWTIPNSEGDLLNTGVGWNEWFAGAESSCSAIPYARTLRTAPTAVPVGSNTAIQSVISDTWTSGGSTVCESAEQSSSSEAVLATGKSQVSPDGSATSTAPSSTSVTVTPRTSGDLLVAYVSTFNAATVTVSGGGLTWTNPLDQGDTVTGDGGRVSVWEALDSNPLPVPAVTVTSTLSGNQGWDQTLFVEAFAGASGIGATAFANGSSTQPPSVNLTPQQSGSWVASVGFDADSTTTVSPATGQTLDATAADTVDLAQMWFQHDTTVDPAGQLVPRFSVAGQQVTAADTLNPAGKWDLGAVEITPVPQVNLEAAASNSGTTNVGVTLAPSSSKNQGLVLQGDLLVAYVATYEGATVSVSSSFPQGSGYNGPNLSWINVLNESDGVTNDGGLISVWAAAVPCNGTQGSCQPPSAVTVTSTISGNVGWLQSLYVQDFQGAQGIGAVGYANGPVTSSPSTQVIPGETGSWIQTVGFDPDSITAVTPGAGQTLDAQFQDGVEDAQAWFAHVDFGTTAGNAVTVGDSLSPAGKWDLGAVEIEPQP